MKEINNIIKKKEDELSKMEIIIKKENDIESEIKRKLDELFKKDCY